MGSLDRKADMTVRYVGRIILEDKQQVQVCVGSSREIAESGIARYIKFMKKYVDTKEWQPNISRENYGWRDV